MDVGKVIQRTRATPSRMQLCNKIPHHRTSLHPSSNMQRSSDLDQPVCNTIQDHSTGMVLVESDLACCTCDVEQFVVLGPRSYFGTDQLLVWPKKCSSDVALEQSSLVSSEMAICKAVRRCLQKSVYSIRSKFGRNRESRENHASNQVKWLNLRFPATFLPIGKSAAWPVPNRVI